MYYIKNLTYEDPIDYGYIKNLLYASIEETKYSSSSDVFEWILPKIIPPPPIQEEEKKEVVNQMIQDLSLSGSHNDIAEEYMSTGRAKLIPDFNFIANEEHFGKYRFKPKRSFSGNKVQSFDTIKLEVIETEHVMDYLKTKRKPAK